MPDIKSTLVTDLDSKQLQGTNKLGGKLFRQAETFTKGAADADGQLYRVLRAWTGWTLDSLVFHCEAWGTNGVMEIGCYDVNGGAAVDADVFATSVSTVSAVPRIDLLAEALAPDKVNTKLRDLLQMAADAPDKWVDLCVLATDTGAAQAAKCSLTLRYIEH